MVEGFCLKEKVTSEIKNPQYELNAKGRPIVRGTCSKCGTKMYKLLGAADVPADLKKKMESFKTKKGGASKKSKNSRKSKQSGSKKSRGSKTSRKRASKKSKK